MTNSLLLFFSCYKINKHLNFFVFILFFLNFFIVEINYLSKPFTYINLFILFFVFLICYLSKYNKYLAPISTLFYSISVDIFCFCFFPLFPIQISIFEYVLNGILFNIKFVIFPCIFVFIFEIFKKYHDKKSMKYSKFSYRNNL